MNGKPTTKVIGVERCREYSNTNSCMLYWICFPSNAHI